MTLKASERNMANFIMSSVAEDNETQYTYNGWHS